MFRKSFPGSFGDEKATTMTDCENDATIKASTDGDISECERLIAKDNALKGAKDENGTTALMFASMRGHLDIVAMLVDHEADIHAFNKRGQTVLPWASMSGFLDIVEFLVDRGADIHAQTKGGVTALMHAVVNGHLDIAVLLVDRGADMEAKRDGETVLMFASSRGHLDIAAMMVDRGADMEARDKDGYTAMTLASREGHSDLAAMLESKSAERAALISSPDLVAIVWASIVAVPPPSSLSSSLSSLSLSPSAISALSAGPPPPFQRCPWPRFVYFFLPPAAAEAAHARVVGARTDAAACIYFLCIRQVQRMTRAGALLPIRNTLRDYLVHSDAATRRLVLELEPMLKR